jgi:hypothetical protein
MNALEKGVIWGCGALLGAALFDWLSEHSRQLKLRKAERAAATILADYGEHKLESAAFDLI